MDDQDQYNTSIEEKLAIPREEKDKGTSLFRQQQYDEASKCYSKALLAVNFLLREGLFPNEQVAEEFITEIQVPCLLNLSLCFIKLNVNYGNVIIHCTDVLKVKPDSVKAYYYRAKAYLETGEYDLCKQDLLEAFELEPNNANIRELWQQMKEKKEAYRDKTKKIAQKFIPESAPRQEQPALPINMWLEIVKGFVSYFRR